MGDTRYALMRCASVAQSGNSSNTNRIPPGPLCVFLVLHERKRIDSLSKLFLQPLRSHPRQIGVSIHVSHFQLHSDYLPCLAVVFKTKIVVARQRSIFLSLMCALQLLHTEHLLYLLQLWPELAQPDAEFYQTREEIPSNH